MPSNSQILNDLDSVLLKNIEELAAGNMAPSDIALKLEINKSAFMRIWREEGSMIRLAYDAGRLEIEALKMKKLKKMIKKGNLTAMQMHDSKAEEAEFIAMKKQVFDLE